MADVDPTKLEDREQTAAAESIRQALHQLAAVNVGQVLTVAHRSPQEDGQNLRPVTRRLLQYYELAMLLRDRSRELDTVPIGVLNELAGDFSLLRNALDQLGAFNVEGGQFPQRNGDSLGQLRHLNSNGAWDRLQRAVAHARRHDPTAEMREAVDRAEEEFRNKTNGVGALEKGALDTLGTVNETLAAAKQALQAAQDAAAQRAITGQSAAFQDAVSRLSRNVTPTTSGIRRSRSPSVQENPPQFHRRSKGRHRAAPPG